jgi:hypothetical protein
MSPIEPDDSVCSRTADGLSLKHRIGYGVVAGIPVVVAGIPVVRYRSSEPSATHDAALAPAFGCELMEEEENTYNDYGWPTSHRRMRVTSYVPGEPDPALLELPPGYQVTERRH